LISNRTEMCAKAVTLSLVPRLGLVTSGLRLCLHLEAEPPKAHPPAEPGDEDILKSWSVWGELTARVGESAKLVGVIDWNLVKR
jgi:hypothetical protein